MATHLEHFQDLLSANEGFRSAFGPDDAGAAKIPSRELVVLTCMDARVDPWRTFGLAAGESHTLRNAGGRVSQDALRSIAISATALGTRRVAVVHHTDCGMLGDEEVLRSALRARGLDVADDEPLLTFSDLEEGVREDVALLRGHPLVPGDVVVAGFVYDVATGEVRPVTA